MKKKIVLLSTALVSSAIIIGATFAWFTAEETALNNFNSRNTIGVELVEDFDASGAQDFKPGVTIDKKVKVVQTANGSAVIRVRLEEFLQRLESNKGIVTIYNETTPTPGDASLLPVIISKSTRDMQIASLGLSMNPIDGGRILNGGAPNRLSVYEKKMINTLGTTYQYVGFYEIESDKYQVVNVTATSANITGVTYQFQKQLDAVTDIHLLNNGDIKFDPNHSNISLNLNGINVKSINDWNGVPEDSWFYDNDGWVYYGRLLKEGITTPTLLESVEMDKSVGNEATDISYKINVRMQAVQPTWEAVEAEWKSNVTQKVAGNFEIIGATTLSKDAENMLKVIISS